jgi:ubiquinone/menaquinone biosynthesis C-methylase UbiE
VAVELGKPADYGQFILERRYQLAKAYAPAALSDGGFYLDVGCGNGAQTVLFAQHFDRWMGVDVEQARLDEFKRELQRGDYPAAKNQHDILFYDGDHLPTADRSVDVLTCIEVIEHTRKDTETIGELFRVLKPGGTAIITVPNKWWIFETHGAHLPVLPWNRVPFFSWLPKPIHERFAKARIYRKRQIELLLEGAGFDVRKSIYVTAPMDMIKQPALQSAIRNTFFGKNETALPFMATSVMLIAKKPISR